MKNINSLYQEFKKSLNSNTSDIIFKKNILNNAKKNKRRILLPEGNEVRIIQAASIISNLDVAECILLGDEKKINSIINSCNISFLNNITIVNPDEIREKYLEILLSLCQEKNITDDSNMIFNIKNNITLSSLMLHNNEVDGIVCGVKYPTSSVLRVALKIIGSKKLDKYRSSLVSSFFFMLFKNQILLYGDCAMNINPNAQQLSEIAISSANLSMMFNIKPKIAMLSYSTGCSGYGDSVDKVRQATQLVKKICPHLIIDGPIQYDAAVDEYISNIKCKFSPLRGKANIFIFPDLNSGNITYKAVQKSYDINAIGPILQGLSKPINDLSRGAKIDDIVYTIAITSIQSQNFF
ncbi:phosphate acetyltransferase [Buchnera aphidicola]|uniref:phosphate acetyltransferase n=1 Tax=Buchnera aphidicola TaxID=9 RepID=UPI00346414F8